jgi:hypothetical protein
LVNRLQIPTKNIQSTQVEGENVKIFKDLKLSIDKYVLHLDFYAMDMYKKKKIALQDVSLNKKDGPTAAKKAVIVKSEVESEEETIEGDEAKP